MTREEFIREYERASYYDLWDFATDQGYEESAPEYVVDAYSACEIIRENIRDYLRNSDLEDVVRYVRNLNAIPDEDDGYFYHYWDDGDFTEVCGDEARDFYESLLLDLDNREFFEEETEEETEAQEEVEPVVYDPPVVEFEGFEYDFTLDEALEEYYVEPEPQEVEIKEPEEEQYEANEIDLLFQF